MTCPECGREFTPRAYATVTIFCSRRCQEHHYRSEGVYNRESITFTCACCGHTVVTEGGGDKRSRFCCRQCERKYWRHPPHEHTSSRQNFRSVEEYAYYERRTNDA